MKIQLESGKILEVQDGATPEDIDAIISEIEAPTPEIMPSAQGASTGLGAVQRGFEQGMTLGFADELKAAMGAAIASPFVKDKSYKELYADSLATQNERLKKDYQDQMAAAISGNVIGGALGAGGVAGLKGLSMVAPNLAKWLVTSKGFMSARAKDLLQGTVTGSIAGAGANSEDRTTGAIVGGITGGILQPVAGAALAGVNKLVGGKAPIEKFITEQTADLQPIRLSAADLGDSEARRVFDLAKTGRLGQEAAELANEFSDAQSRDFATNFLSLYKEGKVSNEVLGEGLAKRLLDAKNMAFEAKTKAYEAATPALKQASISKANLLPLVDDLRNSVSDLDPALVPEVNSILKNAKALEDLIVNKNVKDIKLNTLEALRKRIGGLYDTSLGGKGGRGNLAVQRAKGALDAFSDDLLEQGLIQGDEGALQLIKEARQANKYWKDNFSGQNANSVIRKFINNEGDNLTSDQLLNKFISVSEAGLDGIKAAKEIFGDNIAPIFKQGFLNKIYNSSIVKRPQIDNVGRQILDADGMPMYDDLIQPEKLDRAIERILTKDIQFLKEAGFNAKDFRTLKQLQAVAKRVSSPVDKTNPSGSGNRLIDFMKQRPLLQSIFKLPILGEATEKIQDAYSAAQIRQITGGAGLQSKTALGLMQKPLQIPIYNNPKGKIPPQFQGAQ